MKGNARDLDVILKRGGFSGLLFYGGDALRVAAKRETALETLLGANAEEDMRLTRLHAGDLRQDPASVIDALKATGFFPGPRAVLVEEANNASAPALMAAIGEWGDGDATLVVTAGQLPPSSALRKGFEGGKSVHALAVYDDPPSRGEIEAAMAKAGLGAIDGDAAAALGDLARLVDPGDFAQMLNKLSLYCLDAPVTLADVEACAPAATEAVLDDAIHAVAEGQVAQIGPQLQKLLGQGMNATTICIATARHFRTLHTVASHGGGTGEGFKRLRPPVFGPRRDRMARQVQSWGATRLEDALSVLVEIDLDLRSARPLPQMALLERKLMRISLMCPK